MEILGYILVTIMAVGIIALFAKLLAFALKATVDNDD